MHPSLFGLTAYRQFVLHRNKIPCDITGQPASAHDPSVWMEAATAEAAALLYGPEYGVGFAFAESDPYWFLDIDNCLTPEGWSPLAVRLCTLLSSCAVEISRSGRGLHIFGTGALPPHACRNQALGLELYHAGRYAALTGTGAQGDCLADMSAVLPALVAEYFPPDAGAVAQEWTTEPCEDWRGPADDAELLRRAMQSRSTASAFGGRASFADLWTGNEQALGQSYPDAGGRAYDASAADAALAQHLSFWTGRDCARTERLMRQSALVRDKWETHPTYMQRTVLGAAGRQGDVLQDKEPLPQGSAVQRRKDEGVCGLDKQPEHFAGCIYVSSQNKALVPDGSLLKPESFRVRYGGMLFPLDAANSKSTRDAWEAWTQSQVYVYPQVEGICFKPALPSQAIITRNGHQFVNTYMPVDIARKAGDVSPFLTHLHKVLPDRRDASILLSYMAACVQHQGTKFQWAPLLQGVEGNGKTLFARCVEQAVGARYTHWPKASKLGKDFNAWMRDKVFYAVEDIYVPDARNEIMEDLKPMITGEQLEVESKGVDQVVADICGNFMFNSNHPDAIRKTDNDRRFCMLMSAQQRRSDLARDGMTGDYFPRLYEWLRGEGYAIVSEYLYTYAIPAEFNPALGCHRAPETSTTAEVIKANLGAIEQEIQEAIDQELPGFCGGWISSVKLQELLERIGARRISRLKRKQMLEAMGYQYHPALTDGRPNNPVLPDNSKPRLFVRNDSLAAQIKSGLEAAKDYERCNKGRGMPFSAGGYSHTRGMVGGAESQ